jgi:hypothetical protein
MPSPSGLWYCVIPLTFLDCAQRTCVRRVDIGGIGGTASMVLTAQNASTARYLGNNLGEREALHMPPSPRGRDRGGVAL